MLLDTLTKPILIGRIAIPLIILIIVIICVITLLIILYLFLKESDKSKKKENKVKENKSEEELSQEKKQLNKLHKLRRSIPYLNKNEANEKFIKIVREFFKKLLELNYEFTFDELAEELEKKGRHEEIISFCREISTLKYKKGAITKKQLIKLTKELEGIIKYEDIPEVNKIEKKSFLSALRKPFVSHVRKPPVRNKEEDSKDNQKS